MATSKIHIYQMLVRLLGNKNNVNESNGDIKTNGCGKFDDINEQALKSISNLGMSHVWLTGVLEHASTTDYSAHGIAADPACILKGKAGSPYAIRDYYDVSPDLANNVDLRMDEFLALVKRIHNAELKVVIDFVPNHVSRVYASDNKPEGVADFGESDKKELPFYPQNNFYYVPNSPLHLPTEGDFVEQPAKATGNDCFHAYPSVNDWYETVKLNYGVDYQGGRVAYFDPIPDTWNKMLEILLFWAEKGVDGFRCDMAEMVPVEFWGWVIPQIKAQFPSVLFIAEVYNPDAYRAYIYQGKFDYLYDKVGMYDTVRSIMEGNQSASAISHQWQNTNDIVDHMLYFVENHDEQRVASRFFANKPESGIPATILLSCLNKSPYMVYFGQELGEAALDAEGFSGDDGRTTIFDYWGLASIQRWMNNGAFDGKLLSKAEAKLRNVYQNILSFALHNEAIASGAFYDLQYANYENPNFNGNKLFAFMRYTDTEKMLFVINFSSLTKTFSIHIPVYECEEIW